MKTRSGTLVDGSHHPGHGILYPHLLPGKNGTQTRRVSVLIANHQPIGVTQTKRASALIVDRYTCRTPHLHMHSHCTVQTTSVPWLKGLSKLKTSCVPKTFTHPRVMFHLEPQYTEHQHKFSLTYLSCVTVVYFSDRRPVVHASIHPL